MTAKPGDQSDRREIGGSSAGKRNGRLAWIPPASAWLIVMAVALGFSELTAPAQPAAAAVAPTGFQEFAPPRVVARGPHHRVIQRRQTITSPDGRIRERLSTYTELGTGDGA